MHMSANILKYALWSTVVVDMHAAMVESSSNAMVTVAMVEVAMVEVTMVEFTMVVVAMVEFAVVEVAMIEVEMVDEPAPPVGNV